MLQGLRVRWATRGSLATKVWRVRPDQRVQPDRAARSVLLEWWETPALQVGLEVRAIRDQLVSLEALVLAAKLAQ